MSNPFCYLPREPGCAWCMMFRLIWESSTHVIVDMLTAKAGRHTHKLLRAVHTSSLGTHMLGKIVKESMNEWMKECRYEIRKEGMTECMHACLGKLLNERINACIHNWLVKGLWHRLGHLAGGLHSCLLCFAAMPHRRQDLHMQSMHYHCSPCFAMQQTGWVMLFIDLKGQSFGS